MKAPRKWVEKLARWLPYHKDDYFLSLRSAVWAKEFTFRYQPPEGAEPEDPETKKARANAEMSAFSRRGKSAIDRYRERKSMGRA